jgi:PAS domain S-box-containing protein
MLAHQGYNENVIFISNLLDGAKEPVVTRIKKSSQPATTPRKKQKNNGKLDGRSRVPKRINQRDEAHRKLIDTRNTFYTLFHANPIPTALTRVEDDGFINVNIAFLEYFDLKPEQVLGHTAHELNLGLEPDARAGLIATLQKQGGIRNLEREMTLPSGKTVILLASFQHLYVEDTEAILSTFIDITERKQAEKTLRDMVDSTPDATVVIREDGNIVLVNKQLENTFGYERQDLVGKPLSSFIPERFRQIHQEQRMQYFRDPTIHPLGSGLIRYGRRSDGSEFPVEISLSPLKTLDGMLAIAAIRDVSERTREEQKRRELSVLLSEAEQKERQRLSELLHDDLQQQLFAVMEQGLTESIAITRKLSMDLSPMPLPDDNFRSALTMLSDQMQKQYGLIVGLTTNDIEPNFDNNLRILLFQAVRELLFNVVKHADILQATVTVELVEDEILITVSDEGKGFDVVTLMNDSGIAHGLHNIRRHLEQTGCTMKITSNPGAGTRVVIHCSNIS